MTSLALVSSQARGRDGVGMIELHFGPHLASRATCVDVLTASSFLGRNEVRALVPFSHSNVGSWNLRRYSRRRDGDLVIARMAAGSKAPGTKSEDTYVRTPQNQYKPILPVLKYS